MRAVARVGDVHACPIHGPNTVVKGGSALIDGRPVARVGDPCACGGIIIEGSPGAIDQGKPVAFLGAKTSCGGVITTGSMQAKLK